MRTVGLCDEHLARVTPAQNRMHYHPNMLEKAPKNEK
jgi:hypothetical protein